MKKTVFLFVSAITAALLLGACVKSEQSVYTPEQQEEPARFDTLATSNEPEQPEESATETPTASSRTDANAEINTPTDTLAPSADIAVIGDDYAAMDATALMSGVSPNSVAGRRADAAFTESMADFSIELFKKSVTDGKNSLVSPLSVTLALAMTANGADGETLAQMEKLLGGNIPLDALNEYLYGYANALPNGDKSILNIANSIWFRDSLQVQAAFLQKNADYYGAEAYNSAFDSRTVNDINNWVKTNTDGMIDKVLDEIKDLDMLFLLNAVMFDAEWQNVYYEHNVIKGEFTDITGAVKTTDFMHSNESIYLSDGMATGFIKPYANGGYSFAALLPNEGVSIDEYIGTLTGEGFLDTINNAQSVTVNASMPKFEYAYEIEMSDALKNLGIPNAFDIIMADFSKMATSDIGNIYINRVLHKTFIKVDELGTKAGAVTMVAMDAGGMMPQDIKTVRLDRPFVYAIIDNATNLPVFIGTLMTI